MYGSSAGAINATYFLSGQREGVNIYTDEIACKEFIDLGRLLNFSGKAQGEHSLCILPSGLSLVTAPDWHSHLLDLDTMWKTCAMCQHCLLPLCICLLLDTLHGTAEQAQRETC